MRTDYALEVVVPDPDGDKDFSIGALLNCKTCDPVGRVLMILGIPAVVQVA